MLLQRLSLAAVIAAAVLAVMISSSARALPVLFHFESTITSSSIPGVADNDTVTIDVVLDNGGTSLLSQSWDTNAGTAVLSATASAGSYSADYGTIILLALFSTDAAGNLTSSTFRDESGTGVDNTDSFGSGQPIALFANVALFDVNGNFAQFFPSAFFPAQWTLEFATVNQTPEPTTLTLFAGALAGFTVFSARRRRARRAARSG